MLQLSEIHKSYGPQKLFVDAQLQIHPRERVGLVGRNGTGKTTLIRMIQGTESPELGSVDVSHGYILGWLDQHWRIQHKTVLEEATPILESPDPDNPDPYPEWKVEKMLLGLGFLIDDMQRDPKDFSGGFQMRIQLCRLLLSEPDLLILDEPTNYLDILSLRWLERFLRCWKKELLLVTHDRQFMDRVCTHTACIHREKIKKMKGGVLKLYSQIKLEEETHERTRQNLLKKQAQQEKFIREFRSGARSAGLVQSRIKMLEKQTVPPKLKPIPPIKFKFHESEFHGNWLVKVDKLGFGYTAEQKLFQNLSLEIEPGDRIAIIGPNGYGKTTLLKTLAGELIPSEGKARFHPYLQQGYLPQSHHTVFETDHDILKEFQIHFPTISERELRTLCGHLMFPGRLAHKQVNVLSGGERMRVNLGKILLEPQHLLLLDEPTNHLDLESCQALADSLVQFRGAMVFVSHNEDLLHQVPNKLIVFRPGRVNVYPGTYQQFLDRHGWGDEIDGDLEEKPNKQTVLDPKIQRQQQKLLRSLTTKIKRREEAILKLEAELEQNKQKLEQAYQRGEMQKIHLLGVECDAISQKITPEYEALETLETQKQQLPLELLME